jgi:Rrf2 family protein
MRVTARVAYASLAVFELALQPPTDRVQAKQIAEKRQIPLKFLEQILIQLKNFGIVKSIRGASGGYLLARSADEITLKDIFDAVEGGVHMLESELEGEPTISNVWAEIEKDFRQRLESITIQSLINRSLREKQILSFEI